MALSVAVASTNYYEALSPTLTERTRLSWSVLESPSVAVEWGWSGEGSWIIGEGEEVSFLVQRIHDDVEGQLTLGNFSILANNTDIARELVFGIWGLPPFFPGLVVETGQSSMNKLNETAYASAERVSGNYLNGTMESSYNQVIIGETTYNCIIFNYEQDPTGFSEPQITELAYDLDTGVLVRANTSYSFGTPYILTLELASIAKEPSQFTILLLAGISGIIALVVVMILLKRR